MLIAVSINILLILGVIAVVGWVRTAEKVKKLQAEKETALAQSQKKAAEILEGARDKAQEVMREASADAQDLAGAEKKEVVAGLKQAAAKELIEERKRVRAEVEAEKQKELVQFRAKLPQVVEKVTREVVGKSLTIRDHEELVMKALEEAL